MRGHRPPGEPVAEGGDPRHDREQHRVDEPRPAEESAVAERVGPAAAERGGQELVGEEPVGPAADLRAGEDVVEQEERGQLQQAGQASGQRGHLFLGVQFEHGPLQPLGVLGVLAAQFGDPRLQLGARLLATCGGPGQRVEEESYERGEQDDGGGCGRGAEQGLEQVGEALDQVGENGHGW